MDNNLVAFLVISGWVLSLCLHEFGHALVAYIGGDKSVKEKGYLSFNPFAYTDMRLSIVLPTVFILMGGIGLPGASVRVNDRMLRNRLWSSAVSLAGPVMSILFTLVLIGVIKAFASDNDVMLWSAASYLALLETVVVILNLLPVPGLDGFGIIEPFLPASVKTRLYPLHRYGFIALFGLLWVVPPANQLLWDTARDIVHSLGVPNDFIVLGYTAFKAGALPIGIACIALAAVVAQIKKKTDWSTKAKDLYSKKLYQECADFLDQVLKDKPNEIEAWRMKAICCSLLHYANQKQMISVQRDFKGEALTALDKTLELSQNEPRLLYLKAHCLTLFGQIDDALDCLKSALESGDPDLLKQAQTDPGLSPLREDERFEQMIASLKKGKPINP